MKQELVLQNLFRHLVSEKGFRLGVRDYRDALEALRRGYGLHSPEKLLWLCQTLWARSDDECRVIDSLFKQFSFQVEEKSKELSGSGESLPLFDDAPPIPPFKPPGGKTVDDAKHAPAVDFAAASHQNSGIGLSSAKAELTTSEVFILSPRLIVSMRRLTVVWRRFRAVRREGARVELDLEATIREKCRLGILNEPVLIPARRNQAKLIVLIDVSTSMTPWQEFNKTLVSSLQRGKLGKAAVFYFHNTPDDVLYEKETLIKPQKIDLISRENRDSALLVLSDCGAARGFKSRTRISETRQFLKNISKFWHPVVWLNPMPARRWKNTTAEAVNQLPKVNMYELSEDGLIKAIDVLRGKRIN